MTLASYYIIYNRLVSHFCSTALPTSTISHYSTLFDTSHLETSGYTYTTFFHCKQIIYFSDTSLIRITIDIIDVTKNKYYDTK